MCIFREPPDLRNAPAALGRGLVPLARELERAAQDEHAAGSARLDLHRDGARGGGVREARRASGCQGATLGVESCAGAEPRGVGPGFRCVFWCRGVYFRWVSVQFFTVVVSECK